MWSRNTVTKEPPDLLTKLSFKLALRLADFSTVRDEYSKRFIENHITGKIFLELDLALRLEPDINNTENVLKSSGLDVDDAIVGLNISFLRSGDFGRVLRTLIQNLNLNISEKRTSTLRFFSYPSATVVL